MVGYTTAANLPRSGWVENIWVAVGNGPPVQKALPRLLTMTGTDYGSGNFIEATQGGSEPYIVLNMYARSDINGSWYSYDAGDTYYTAGYIIEYELRETNSNILPVDLDLVAAGTGGFKILGEFDQRLGRR